MIFSHPGILLGSYTHTHTGYIFMMILWLNVGARPRRWVDPLWPCWFWSRPAPSGGGPARRRHSPRSTWSPCTTSWSRGRSSPSENWTWCPLVGIQEHTRQHEVLPGACSLCSTYFKLLVKYLFQDVTTTLTDLSFRPRLVSTLHEPSSLAVLFPLLPLFVQQPSFYQITSPPLVL